MWDNEKSNTVMTFEDICPNIHNLNNNFKSERRNDGVMKDVFVITVIFFC